MWLTKKIKHILEIDKLQESISNIEMAISRIEKDIYKIDDALDYILTGNTEILNAQSDDYDEIVKLLNEVKSKISSIPREITVKNVLSI